MWQLPRYPLRDVQNETTFELSQESETLAYKT